MGRILCPWQGTGKDTGRGTGKGTGKGTEKCIGRDWREGSHIYLKVKACKKSGEIVEFLTFEIVFGNTLGH